MGLTAEEARALYDFVKFLTYLGLIVLIIRTIFRLLKWLYHAIWPAKTQAKQRTKLQVSRKKPVKKQFKEKQWYPTGWYIVHFSFVFCLNPRGQNWQISFPLPKSPETAKTVLTIPKKVILYT